MRRTIVGEILNLQDTTESIKLDIKETTKSVKETSEVIGLMLGNNIVKVINDANDLTSGGGRYIIALGGNHINDYVVISKDFSVVSMGQRVYLKQGVYKITTTFQNLTVSEYTGQGFIAYFNKSESDSLGETKYIDIDVSKVLSSSIYRHYIKLFIKIANDEKGYVMFELFNNTSTPYTTYNELYTNLTESLAYGYFTTIDGDFIVNRIVKGNNKIDVQGWLVGDITGGLPISEMNSLSDVNSYELYEVVNSSTQLEISDTVTKLN